MAAEIVKVPTSRKPDVVRKRILDAALAEFMAEGFAGASTNRIMAGFGGSKPTMFRHFPTKRALFEGVVARIAASWTGHVHPETLEGHLPRPWLTGFGLAALLWLLSEENLFVGRMAMAEGSAFPEVAETYRNLAVRPIEATVAERLRRWTTEGRLACPEPELDATAFLDMTLSGMVSRALYGEPITRDADALRPHLERRVGIFLGGRAVYDRRQGEPSEGG